MGNTPSCTTRRSPSHNAPTTTTNLAPPPSQTIFSSDASRRDNQRITASNAQVPEQKTRRQEPPVVAAQLTNPPSSSLQGKATLAATTSRATPSKLDRGEKDPTFLAVRAFISEEVFPYWKTSSVPKNELYQSIYYCERRKFDALYKQIRELSDEIGYTCTRVGSTPESIERQRVTWEQQFDTLKVEINKYKEAFLNCRAWDAALQNHTSVQNAATVQETSFDPYIFAERETIYQKTQDFLKNDLGKDREVLKASCHPHKISDLLISEILNRVNRFEKIHQLSSQRKITQNEEENKKEEANIRNRITLLHNTATSETLHKIDLLKRNTLELLYRILNDCSNPLIPPSDTCREVWEAHLKELKIDINKHMYHWASLLCGLDLPFQEAIEGENETHQLLLANQKFIANLQEIGLEFTQLEKAFQTLQNRIIEESDPLKKQGLKMDLQELQKKRAELEESQKKILTTALNWPHLLTSRGDYWKVKNRSPDPHSSPKLASSAETNATPTT